MKWDQLWKIILTTTNISKKKKKEYKLLPFEQLKEIKGLCRLLDFARFYIDSY